jgi:hypothetical protein
LPHVEIFDSSCKQKWKDALSLFQPERNDIYFSCQYHSVFENYGDGRANCFFYSEGNDAFLYPYLINSINQLGYSLKQEYYDIQSVYGYAGPITTNKQNEFIKSAHAAFNDHCRNSNIVAEFIRFHPLINNRLWSDDSVNMIFDRETVVIDLRNGYDSIWKDQYSSKNRNIIRKAEKLKYSIEFHNNPNVKHIEKFIELYSLNMSKVVAKDYYFFNGDFFKDMFSNLSENLILGIVLDSNNLTVASSIFLTCNDYFHYHLSGRRPNSDNSINNYLIDRAIHYASKNKFRYVHLGGGRSNERGDSLLKFKKSFSNINGEFFIGKKIHDQTVYDDIVQQWINKFPEQAKNNNNILLKYRVQ